jgi:hypothetical protein
MSFLGQFNFGYPITSQNIIKTAPNNAVLPLSIGSSLQGNILGITVADFASSLSPSLYDDEGNTFIGENVFNTISNPTKVLNTAIGKDALKNTVGGQNIGIGVETLYDNTTGFQNIAIGNQALYRNTTGENNVVIGVASMLTNTTGKNNVAIGTFSLLDNTTGRSNIAIGDYVGAGNTTGQFNIMIGQEVNNQNFSNCIMLGRHSQATASNQFVVGSALTPVGPVTSEINTSTSVWNVKINGVDRKILLA